MLGTQCLGSQVDGLRRVWVLPVSKLDFRGDAMGQFLVRQWIHVLRQLREVL